MTVRTDQERSRPNVIFILSDDQGPWAASCYGNTEIRTPNIDALASEGIRLDRFFCTSPVCSPARASIVTGRIPSQHGVHDWIRDGNMAPGASVYLERFRSYTDILAADGYVCGLSGKWHLGDSINSQHGFTHWFCHQRGGGPYNNAPMIRDGVRVTAEGYVTDRITDDALTFLDENREHPFYLSVHYTAPHSPWTGHPQDIVDSYDDCPFASCPQEPLHPGAGPLTRRAYGDREMLKGYFAAVTAMDLNIGRIISKVEQLGLTERTLFVFTSDNGFSCGHHGFWGKGNGTFPVNMYESSVRVPMIFSHPGRLARGRVCDALASQYDLFPTLLDYVGITPPADPDLPGMTLLPVLEGERAQTREDLVVYDEYGPVRMIRTEEWKYVHRFPFGHHELYDVQKDPQERHNLCDDPARASLVAELRGRLFRWFDRYVDPEMDGVRLPVTGSGQRTRIENGPAGVDCFYNDRLVTGPDGIPRMDDQPGQDRLSDLIQDR